MLTGIRAWAQRGVASTLVVTGLALAPLSVPAFAADTVQVMIPAAPGGGWDRTGRLAMGAMQKEKLVGAVQFTNKGGAGGVIGLTEFVRTEKGNDNALMLTGVIMLGSVITAKSPVTLEQTTPLARLTLEYLGVGVPADSPYKTIKEFADALKSDPSGTTVGASSIGSVEHVTLALMAKAQGVPLDKLNVIIFSGNEYVPALVGGKIKAMITGINELVPLAKAGRVKILAVTSEGAIDGVDAPSLKQAGFDIVIGNWRGIVGAPDMSDKARAEWVDKFGKLSKTTAWKEALAQQGLADAYMPGPEFGAFIDAEQTRWVTTLTELGLIK